MWDCFFFLFFVFYTFLFFFIKEVKFSVFIQMWKLLTKKGQTPDFLIHCRPESYDLCLCSFYESEQQYPAPRINFTRVEAAFFSFFFFLPFAKHITQRLHKSCMSKRKSLKKKKYFSALAIEQRRGGGENNDCPPPLRFPACLHTVHMSAQRYYHINIH